MPISNCRRATLYETTPTTPITAKTSASPPEHHEQDRRKSRRLQRPVGLLADGPHSRQRQIAVERTDFVDDGLFHRLGIAGCAYAEGQLARGRLRHAQEGKRQVLFAQRPVFAVAHDAHDSSTFAASAADQFSHDVNSFTPATRQGFVDDNDRLRLAAFLRP